MTLIQALILGIVQGLTEFLPISSSGHLVIGQHLFGLQHADLAFDVSVHLGTLGAVVIFFRSDILAILTALLRWRPLGRGARPAQERLDPGVRLAMLVIMGSVPTALIGLTLKRFEETLFASPLIAGVMLLITGGVLFLTRGPQATARAHPESTRPLAAIRVRDSLLIGIVQGLAVMPGISRSGATIATGLFAGIELQAAARGFHSCFRFRRWPARHYWCFWRRGPGAGRCHRLAQVGGLAALIVGYAALAILVFLIKKGKLHIFAPYRWIVGLAAIALGPVALPGAERLDYRKPHAAPRHQDFQRPVFLHLRRGDRRGHRSPAAAGLRLGHRGQRLCHRHDFRDLLHRPHAFHPGFRARFRSPRAQTFIVAGMLGYALVYLSPMSRSAVSRP